MKRRVVPVLFALSLVTPFLAQAEEGDFISLFNGQDLSGWDGDPKLWTVEDGVIVGTCEGREHFPHNTFLIWRDGTVEDFELRATVRIEGDNNSGIQYRSRPLPERGEWAITGYQHDVHPAIEHMGMTYEERGRGIFGLNGRNILVDPEGERWLVSEHEPVAADLTEWTEFTVVARGNHLVHKVNGEITSQMWDYDEEKRALSGLVAIQLHSGNAHRLEIKDVQLKTLPVTEPAAFDPAKVKGAEKIEKPRTSRPMGKGKAKAKAKGKAQPKG